MGGHLQLSYDGPPPIADPQNECRPSPEGGARESLSVDLSVKGVCGQCGAGGWSCRSPDSASSCIRSTPPSTVVGVGVRSCWADCPDADSPTDTSTATIITGPVRMTGALVCGRPCVCRCERSVRQRTAPYNYISFRLTPRITRSFFTRSSFRRAACGPL